jgi:hypothetical protein
MAERNERIEMMKLAGAQNVSLSQIKADLAGTTMKLRTQKELAANSNKSPQVVKPAVEPPKRAPDGQAFAK